MAPAWLVRRLVVPAASCFILFLTSVIRTTDSLWTYDRTELLNIKVLVDSCAEYHYDGSKARPSYLADVPEHLLHLKALLPRKRRRRGVRSGRLVRLKSWLAHWPGLAWSSSSIPRGYEACFHRLVSGRTIARAGRCLVPIVGQQEKNFPVRHSRPLPRGVNPGNLRRVSRVAPAANLTEASTKCALVNARSVMNKSFILRDFFITHSLDLLFITESWINLGESAVFSELLPPDCTFINTPRTTGRGGGIATILKNSLHCKPLAMTFTSFELSCFELGVWNPVLCAVIYRPPKHNQYFIKDFSDFIAGVRTNYDKILIVGDFNVHVCCPSKAMAKDLLDLIDAFNLIQHVEVPTQIHGHTLDLVLSYGLPIDDLLLSDAIFSDHCPVMFNFVSNGLVKPHASVRHSRTFKRDTALCFPPLFTAHVQANDSSAASDTEQLTNAFLSTCSDVLDTVAPVRAMRPRPKREPWLCEATRAARQVCRGAERRWKKDGLQISYQILQDSWRNYQKIVKAKQTQYFSEIVSQNANNPRILFKTIGAVLNPPQSTTIEFSIDICEKFLDFFNSKVSNIRANILPSSLKFSISMYCSALFSQFEPVSLTSLTKIVSQLKPSTSPTDPVPPHLFKEVWATIGPHVHAIINSSLSSGVVPAFCKKAVIEPLIKKAGLDPTTVLNYRPIS